MEDYGLLREAAEVGIVVIAVIDGFVGTAGVGNRLTLDTRPSEVDVEQQKKDTEAYY